MALKRAKTHLRTLLADSLTPVEAFRRLRRASPVGFLLESVTGGVQVARFSFLACGPSHLLRLYPDRAELADGNSADSRRLAGPPLAAFAEELQRVRGDRTELPFAGGWVSYFGFETAALLERLPPPRPDPRGLPLAVAARFNSGAAFDHARQRLVLFANEIDGEVSASAAHGELERLAAALRLPADPDHGAELPHLAPGPAAPAEAAWSGEAFQEAVRRAQGHIERGDAFQIVLARHFRIASRITSRIAANTAQGISPLEIYRALRVVNPSPYMVLLELPEVALAGASPEMLVRVTGRRVEVRPIAGTRPRGATPEEDRRLAAELLADEKERAEHLMLVDLGRNDLGRIARAGSVRVDELMSVERYSHVMHLVSGVSAELAAGRGALDAFFACFPAGTVSGAPKIRAMEILRRLEPEARGPYAGAVGYLSFSGDLDTCITIRTVICQQGGLTVTAGAGIVADSRPEAEQRETEDKAAALLAAVGLARRFHEP
ncbi:MAG: anthranilate synthase component I family protein [Thermoanaerobaculia bacterium]